MIRVRQSLTTVDIDDELVDDENDEETFDWTKSGNTHSPSEQRNKHKCWTAKSMAVRATPTDDDDKEEGNVDGVWNGRCLSNDICSIIHRPVTERQEVL